MDTLKANMLKNVMAQIPRRSMKDAVNRVIGQGNIVKGILKDLEARTKNLPRSAIKIWKNYVERIKTGALIDNVRAHAIKSNLQQIQTRTARDGLKRIVGQGNIVTGVLKQLDQRLRQIPREALQKWKGYVNHVKTGAILDNLRAEKLNTTLNKIPVRVLKDTHHRIIGQGNLVMGVLKDLENRLRQIPRDALRKWRVYVTHVKTGAILDSLRAERLKTSLNSIPQRVMKDCVQRLIGEGDKILGMLKNLEKKIK